MEAPVSTWPRAGVQSLLSGLEGRIDVLARKKDTKHPNIVMGNPVSE